MNEPLHPAHAAFPGVVRPERSFQLVRATKGILTHLENRDGELLCGKEHGYFVDGVANCPHCLRAAFPEDYSDA